MAVAISFIEIVGHLFGLSETFRGLIRRLLGRNGEKQSDMDQAMFWVRVAGLMLFGWLAIAVSFTVLGA